jgi:hypothetical protein
MCRFKTDEKFKHTWLYCMQVKAGRQDKVDGILPSSIEAEERVFIRSTRSYVCHTKGTFSKAVSKMPWEMDVKPTTLGIDAAKQIVQGYIVQNPLRESVEIELIHEKGVRKADQHVKAADHIYKDQADEFFNYVRNIEMSEVNSFLNAPTMESLLRKASLLQEFGGADEDVDDENEKSGVAVAQSEASASSGSGIIRPPMSSSASQAIQPPEALASRLMPPPKTTPTKLSKAPQSLLALSPASSKASSERSQCESEEDEMVEDADLASVAGHIQRVNLQKILGGSKLGQVIRRGRDFCKMNRKLADIDTLSCHLDKADFCTSFHRNGHVTMKKEMLQKGLTALKADQDVIPSDMKEKLLNLSIIEWESKTAELTMKQAGAFFKLVCPWVYAGKADEYDPLHTTLLDLDGSTKEKVVMYRDFVVKRGLVPFIKSGEDGLSSVQVFCKCAIEEMLEAPEDFADDYGEVVGFMMIGFRACLALAIGSGPNSGTVDEVVRVFEAPAKNILSSIHAAIKNTPFWADKKKAFFEFRTANERYGPQLQQAMAALQKKGRLVNAAAVSKYLPFLQEIQEHMEDGKADELETLLHEHVEAIIAATSLVMESGGINTVLCLDEIVEMTKSADTVFGRDASRKLFLEAVASRKSRQYCEEALNTLLQACVQANADLLTEIMAVGGLANLDACLEQCGDSKQHEDQQHLLTVVTEIKVECRNFHLRLCLAIISEHSITDCAGFMQFEGALNTMSKLEVWVDAKADLSFVMHFKGAVAAREALESVLGLADSISKVESLGSSVEDRATYLEANQQLLKTFLITDMKVRQVLGDWQSQVDDDPLQVLNLDLVAKAGEQLTLSLRTELCKRAQASCFQEVSEEHPLDVICGGINVKDRVWSDDIPEEHTNDFSLVQQHVESVVVGEPDFLDKAVLQASNALKYYKETCERFAVSPLPDWYEARMKMAIRARMTCVEVFVAKAFTVMPANPIKLKGFLKKQEQIAIEEGFLMEMQPAILVEIQRITRTVYSAVSQ